MIMENLWKEETEDTLDYRTWSQEEKGKWREVRKWKNLEEVKF